MAPLKQVEAEVNAFGGPLAVFPRLKRRGPIEAGDSEKEGIYQTIFPRLKRRGPIEAPTEEENREVQR